MTCFASASVCLSSIAISVLPRPSVYFQPHFLTIVTCILNVTPQLSYMDVTRYTPCLMHYIEHSK